MFVFKKLDSLTQSSKLEGGGTQGPGPCLLDVILRKNSVSYMQAVLKQPKSSESAKFLYIFEKIAYLQLFRVLLVVLRGT